MKILVKITKERKFLIIEATDFHLITQGKTLEEAKNNFVEAFNLAMEDPDYKAYIEKALQEKESKKQKNLFFSLEMECMSSAQTPDTLRQRVNATSS